MFTVDLHRILHFTLLISVINLMWFILYNTSLSINHSLNITNTVIVVSVRCRDGVHSRLCNGFRYLAYWNPSPNQFIHVTFLIIAFITHRLFVFCLFVYGLSFIHYYTNTSPFCNLVLFLRHIQQDYLALNVLFTIYTRCLFNFWMV